MDITKQEFMDENVLQRNDSFFEWFLEQEPGEHTVTIEVKNDEGKVIRHKVTSKMQRLLQQALHDHEVYTAIKYGSRERYVRRKDKRSKSLSPEARDRS